MKERQASVLLKIETNSRIQAFFLPPSPLDIAAATVSIAFMILFSFILFKKQEYNSVSHRIAHRNSKYIVVMTILQFAQTDKDTQLFCKIDISLVFLSIYLCAVWIVELMMVYIQFKSSSSDVDIPARIYEQFSTN